ncbi:MAG TPA: hypothetical protein VF549_15510 [Solirubrobacteraceae bacterium]
MSDHEDRRVSLPTHVYVIAAIFGVLMLGLLAVQLIMINDQRTTTDEQLAIQARQSARAIPLLDDTRTFVDEVSAALPGAKRIGEQARELGQDTSTLLDAAKPLVDDLADAQIDQNLRAAGALAATLLDADVGDATRAGRALAAELLRADLPRLAQYLEAAASELLYKNRLRRLLVRGSLVLGEMRQRAFVPKVARAAELAPPQFRVLQRSLAVQEQTLAIQKEALAAIQETLAVAKEAERHAESLDNKTGGSAASPTGTVPVPTG